MPIRRYNPSFSNIQIVGCGEGGTTAGRIVTGKRCKSQRDRYLQGEKDFQKEIAISPAGTNTYRRKIRKDPSLLTRIPISSSNDSFHYERIIIGKSPSINKPIHMQDRKRAVITQNKNENQYYSTDLFDTIKSIVAEYNKNKTKYNLSKFLDNKSKNEQKFLKDYFDSVTNGFLRILSPDNSCSIVLKNPKKDRFLKIIYPTFS